jgi:hypothetical protein
MTREGAEWVVTVPNEENSTPEGWGTQSEKEFSAWMRHANEAAQRLAEKLEAGPWSHMRAVGMDRKMVLLPAKNKTFLVAWPSAAESSSIFEQSKKLVTSWDS